MKKKVLIIHDSMGGGGAERVLVTLLQALDPEKFDVTLLLIYSEGPFFSSIPQHVKVKWLFKSYASKGVRLLTHFYPVRSLVRERKARRLLGDDRFDVTVSFMEGPAAKLHSQLFDYAPRNMSWVHCNQRIGRWYDFWFRLDEEKRFYAKLDKVAFVSCELRDEFLGIFETRAEKVVIYNPVDGPFLESRAAESPKSGNGVFSIVNSGRLVAQKNHHLLIEVASLLRDHGRSFVIDVLGQGPLREELEAEVARRGLESHLRFRGFASNPFPAIKGADLFCMTSVWEGCPMVVAESLTLGTPVVSTPIKAVGEMLSSGGGILTDGTSADIAAAIERLMDDPDEIARMGDDAKRSATRFNLASIVGEVTDFIAK